MLSPISQVTQIERFANLVRVLRDVEARALPFNMTTWKQDLSCNSAGCAIGWAFSDPWFKAQGCGLRFIGEYARRLTPAIHGECNRQNLNAFFGLSWSHFNFLFMPDSYWPELRELEGAEPDAIMDGEEQQITPLMVLRHVYDLMPDLGIAPSFIGLEAMP